MIGVFSFLFSFTQITKYMHNESLTEIEIVQIVNVNKMYVKVSKNDKHMVSTY